MVFAKVRGRFAGWSGSLELDPGDLSRSAVEVEIDASSIDTGVGDRDDHLRSGGFFDVEHFPTVAFKSRQVEHEGGDRYRILGDLTIRDVTREVVLETEYGGKGKDPYGNQRVAFTAHTSIDRRDFGLTWNQVLEAGGVLVGERIAIEIDVQAVRAAQETADEQRVEAHA
jgi:polyisoprenoid-binding protein YceI